MSGTPINVESNIIQTLTPGEHIKSSCRTLQNRQNKEVRDTVSKQTPKNPQKYFLSFLEYIKD